jgi:hypothetical protein
LELELALKLALGVSDVPSTHGVAQASTTVREEGAVSAAAVGRGVPDATRVVVALLLRRIRVDAAHRASSVVIRSDVAKRISPAEIADLRPNNSGVLLLGEAVAGLTAFLASVVPHAVSITVARRGVGVLEAALLEADGVGRVVVILAAVSSIADRRRHLRAGEDALVLEPFAFGGTSALVARLEEAAVFAASVRSGVPVAVRQEFTVGFSLGIHLALDSAALRSRIPVADVRVGLAVDRVQDASAVGGASTLDGVNHAARSVVGADFEVVLEVHLTGLDTAATEPFAGTTGVAIIRVTNDFALLDANSASSVPGASEVSVASCQVAVLVLAFALAGTVLVLAHVVLSAGTNIIDELAHGVATVALEVPHTVDVSVARELRTILVGALEVARCTTDDAHGLSLTFSEVLDARADGCALRGGDVPHALAVSVTSTRVGVTEGADFLA